MAKQLLFRGGNTAGHNAFTGGNKEITVDTQKKTLVVHDGATPGGSPLAKESSLNDHINSTGNVHEIEFSEINSKPNTLAGYGITDADTKDEVSLKINNAVNTAVSDLVDSSPELLNTLDELANAIGDDPNFATTVANSIAAKVTKNADIVAGTGTKVTYDAKGLVTSSTTPTTLAGYSISDAYTKTEVNNSLALKVDDSEIASVNLLRADKYLAAQNIANMSYTDGNLTKIQYNAATNVDYEVFTYGSGNLTSIQHYVGSALKGTTTLSYTSGNLISAIFVGV